MSDHEPVIGSLCSGYGGLDLGVQAVLGGRVAWHVEYDKDPSAILRHHWPDVPNHGDVKTTDWTTVEPVDILTAGYPCQPFSGAGLRKGSNDPRHLWPDVARAVGALRPGLVVLENVRGHVSLGLADVLGDLSALGYDAAWGVVRASDTGAPHTRARIFILAAPYTDGGRPPQLLRDRGTQGLPIPGEHGGNPTPPDSGRQRHGQGKVGGGVGRVDDPNAGTARERQRARRVPLDRGPADRWGPYGPAVLRWEGIIGRPAPDPTEPGDGGRPRLSAPFVEWMMGLDPGHVTGSEIARTSQLKALGNGVVPQQASLALRTLLPILTGP